MFVCDLNLMHDRCSKQFFLGGFGFYFEEKNGFLVYLNLNIILF